MTLARFFDPLVVILIGSVALAMIVVVRDKDRIRALMTVTPRVALLGAAAATVMVAVTYMVFALLVRWLPSIRIEASSIYARFLAGHSIPITLAAVVPVIVAEELIWRGTFQDSTGKWGAIITPLVYALAHFPLGSALLVSVAFVCGLYWSLLRMFSRSLVPSLCAHLAWDIALILFPLFSR